MLVSTAPPEVPLGGGDVTEGVVRVGETVRRPTRRSTPAVHSLLRHLAAVGFDGAPRVLGMDGQGREILSYLPGAPALLPLRPHAVSAETLVALAELLRRLHDAAQSFVPPPDAFWEPGSSDDREPELIGHCDITPENVIFRDQVPYAFIDFDLARPTTRLFDVVTTLRHWAPIADPIDRDPLQRRLDVGARLRLFCDAYGLPAGDRRRLVDVARLRFDRSYVAMRTRAITDGGGWARMWVSGSGDRIRRARAWLDAHQDRLDECLR